MPEQPEVGLMYEYSDAQRQMWRIHDTRRTAVLSSRYYSIRFCRMSQFCLAVRLAGVLGAVGMLVQTISQSGPPAMTIICVAVVIASSLVPFMGLLDQVSRAQSMRDAWRRQAAALERFIEEVTLRGALIREDTVVFCCYLEYQKMLQSADESDPDEALVKRLTREVNEQFPISSLWMPAH